MGAEGKPSGTHPDEGNAGAEDRVSERRRPRALPIRRPSYAKRLLEGHPERVGYLLKERTFDIATVLDALRKIVDVPIAEEISNEAIASRQFVTERKVGAHVTQIFRKLDLTESAGHHRRVLGVLTLLRA